MPAHRAPTAINEARGTYKKNPQRARAREHEPVVKDPIGPPPDCFLPNGEGYQSSEQKELVALWHELISIAADGVLNRSHRWHLESTCRLKYKERHRIAKPGDITNLNKHLSQMGMNPASQSTVSGKRGADPDEEETVFSRLSQKGRAARA